MGLISLENMEFFAYHGCFEEEQVIGTRFLVDLHLDVNTEKAELTDDLHRTVNYLTVYQLVKTEMEIKSRLLEHVGRRILNAIKAKFPDVHHAEVKVSKLNPPLGGKLGSVSVTLRTDEIDGQY